MFGTGVVPPPPISILQSPPTSGTPMSSPMYPSNKASSVPLGQPTIILPSNTAQPIPIGLSWNEVQTDDGRVYFFNSATGASQWVKPGELMTEPESAVLNTNWREYKIWDGRSYFFNDKTKCSVWTVPPDVQIAQAQNLDSVDPDAIEYDQAEKRVKSHADRRAEFYALLTERRVDESLSFADAMEAIKDDIRFHALPTPQAKQLFFASYISNLIKQRSHEARDAKRALYIEAVTEWKNWKGMSESVTFSQMEATFKGKSWFKALDRVDLIKLFQAFAIEFLEIEKLKRQKLQDTLMHEMKNDVLSRQAEFDLGSLAVVEAIHQFYSQMDPKPQFWSYLTDSQKLIVIKSCMSQRIREIKMAVANSLPLSREKRAGRKERDRIKLLISEWINASTESTVVTRGQAAVIPNWDHNLEELLSSKKIDVQHAKAVFAEYVDDAKHGRDPLEGIV